VPPTRGLRRIQLSTADPEPIADFYADLLGWVVLVDTNGVVGGWVGDRLAARVLHPAPDGPEGWEVVFTGPEQHDLDDGAGAHAVVDHGRVLHGPWAPPPRDGEPCWVELMSPADTDEYWARELGWRARTPQDPFTLYDAEHDGTTRPVAGRLREDHGLGTGWMCYFSVPDAAAAAATAQSLGGLVLVPPTPTPTGVVTAIADPAGAVCTLLQTPEGWGGNWAKT
jgi:predicted enzyme related to lactoylglutathione lyase